MTRILRAMTERGAALWLGVALCVLAAGPAQAALQLCNQTSYVLYTAIGIQQQSTIATRGWTHILPGDCATPVAEPLTAPAYFVYAHTSQVHSGASRAWGGSFRLCVSNAQFSLQSPASATACRSDDAFLVPFAPVATGGAKSWTTTFTESEKIASLDDARLAGISRLLTDIGYRIGAWRHAREIALAKFRARADLPRSVSAPALFAALEAEAGRVTAPAGYSICNDGGTEIWAALALHAGADFVSRGWWKIAPGGCARALSDPLASGHVYLFAAKHGNNHLVSGPEMFCTADKAFDVQGRGHCATRGLAETGFMATNLRGAPGYTAHIGNNGLADPIGPAP